MARRYGSVMLTRDKFTISAVVWAIYLFYKLSLFLPIMRFMPFAEFGKTVAAFEPLSLGVYYLFGSLVPALGVLNILLNIGYLVALIMLRIQPRKWLLCISLIAPLMNLFLLVAAFITFGTKIFSTSPGGVSMFGHVFAMLSLILTASAFHDWHPERY